MTNSGTKKWKHVKLVHVDGFAPLNGSVDIPEVKPGESVVLEVHFPSIGYDDPDFIKR